ncbi:uncharacterized protein LOC121822044 [Peromyscus maniculatus bairdii]|uniref:uncharacterized protein LOC121822044 n=1 Tax=Peromyscus maniculatus bairdii TaxID=230844 RepID=UPI003FD52B8E
MSSRGRGQQRRGLGLHVAPSVSPSAPIASAGLKESPPPRYVCPPPTPPPACWTWGVELPLPGLRPTSFLQPQRPSLTRLLERKGKGPEEMSERCVERQAPVEVSRGTGGLSQHLHYSWQPHPVYRSLATSSDELNSTVVYSRWRPLLDQAVPAETTRKENWS